MRLPPAVEQPAASEVLVGVTVPSALTPIGRLMCVLSQQPMPKLQSHPAAHIDLQVPLSDASAGAGDRTSGPSQFVGGSVLHVKARPCRNLKASWPNFSRATAEKEGILRDISE